MTALARGQNVPAPTLQFDADITGALPGSVDVMVFQVTAQGTVRSDDDFVFFNHPQSPEGAVRLTGSSTVNINLGLIPADIATLRIAVCLDDSVPGSLANVPGLSVRLGAVSAPATGLTTERAAVLAEVYRRNEQWKIRNVSAGWDGGLASLVTEHGVAVDNPGAPSPNTPPPAPAAPPAPATPVTPSSPVPPAAPTPPGYAAPPGYAPPEPGYGQPPASQPGYPAPGFPPGAQPGFGPPSPSYPTPPTNPGAPQQNPAPYPAPPAPAYQQPGYPQQPSAAPPAGPPINLQKITLTKAAPSISLSKNETTQGVMRINLNWAQKKGFFAEKIDLDLACMFELSDGYRSMVQALGNAFGNLQQEPWIQLDKDDRTGQVKGGENLLINLAHLDKIKRILVFAYIYEGAANWAKADGVVTIFPPNSPPIEVFLDSPENGAISCAIAMLEVHNGQLTVNREVRYIRGSQSTVSEVYNWGLNFKPGRK